MIRNKRLDFVVSPEIVALVTSLVVGVGTGLSAIVLNLLIRYVGMVSFEWLPAVLPGGWQLAILIAPAIGGLITGLMVYWFAREARGHGVPEVMQAIALKGGRIQPKVVLVKTLTSAVTIGSGGSVGREGPIVQIGAGLGSAVGQVLRLNDERVRNLVASGAAAGIAAAFNAPIAGVIFTLEVILGELTVTHVITVVTSAVTASAVVRAIVGSEYIFPVSEPYTIQSIWEFGFYAVLGVLAGLVAVAFVRTLYWTEDAFEHQKFLPTWLQPAIGGLLLGALALLYPLVMPALHYDGLPTIFGGGYGPIGVALAGRELILVALALMVLKLVATDLTLGSGGSGGVFAPALFMGAMLGLAVGVVVNTIFPAISAPAGAYALVGMGAVFAGATQAPITAVVLLFELTGDYRIILPLMLTVVIALLVGRAMLDGNSIDTLKLTRRGIRLQRGRDVDVMQSVRVGEIMSRNVAGVSTDTSLVDLSERFSHERERGLPVVDADGKLWGIVTLSDVERAVSENRPRRTPVSEIATPRAKLVVTYPDDSMGDALMRMGTRGLGRLPVVSHEDPNELLGMLRREDAIRAYHVALTRRAELEHRTKRMQLRNLDGTEFVDVKLEPYSPAAGLTVGEVARNMPDECILIGIRRHGQMLIPHGSDVFQPGDVVTAFVRSADTSTLVSCLKGKKPAD